MVAFYVILCITPAAMAAAWIALRFGRRRRVPRAFFVVSLVSVVACGVFAWLLIEYPAPTSNDEDMGNGFLILIAGANAVLGSALLAVLALLPRSAPEVGASQK